MKGARTDFGEAPPGYIPGAGNFQIFFSHSKIIGRGAVGFTTTADYVTASDIINTEDEKGLLGLFNDQEDDVADQTWDSVTQYMDGRRKRRREEKEKEILKLYRRKKPKITSNFADCKEGLRSMSQEEWNSIPEGEDRSHKRRKFQKFTPVPDTILIDAVSKESNFPINQLKEKIVERQLQKVEDSVTGKSSVDPKNYINELDSMVIMRDRDITDLKKARNMYESVRKCNPTSASAWIGSARIEELAGKLSVARKIILKACQIVPKNENIWLEAARLCDRETAKSILANGVEKLPKSEKLWLKASELEENLKSKRKVFRKALEENPRSVLLWKEAVELEDEEGARIMLSKAKDFLSDNVDIWLALARLESYEQAKRVLNEARKKLPREPLIWITAAQLEENNGVLNKVDLIIRKGIMALSQANVLMERQQWIQFAYQSEEGGHLVTCRAIINHSLSFQAKEEDYKEIWVDEGERATQSKHIETARTIYAHGYRYFPKKKIFWMKAYQLEKQMGNFNEMIQILSNAVKSAPHKEIFWLHLAKEKWSSGDVEGSRMILENSFKYHQNSEDIWLAVVKIESTRNNIKEARALLTKALTVVESSRIWMKSAIFERDMGQWKKEMSILDEALKKYKDDPKLWIMRGQCEERIGDKEKVIQIYKKGLEFCNDSVELWCCAIINELLKKRIAQARGLINKAMLCIPKNEKLWHLSVQLEMYCNCNDLAKLVLAKGLVECPQSGLLWGEAITLETKAKQNYRIKVAEETLTEENPFVMLSIGKKLWKDGSLDRARHYFNQAVKLDKTLGDTWIWCYKFEIINGSYENQLNVLKLCKESQPYRGDIWCNISKHVNNLKLNSEEILKRGTKFVDVFYPKIVLSSFVYS